MSPKTETEHYYTEKQTSAFRPQKVRMRGLGTEFSMYTAGGVFSPKKLDNGTRLLVKNAILEKGWKVLDFGCGYGVVGVTLKKRNSSLDVVMSDVNSRAVKLSRMNAELHNVKVLVIHSDIFKDKELSAMKFDTILLNPPQTAGKDVCHRMIEDSADHLNKGGLLQLVARHQKGGKGLSQKMEDVFGNVRETAKGSGFRVYVSEKE